MTDSAPDMARYAGFWRRAMASLIDWVILKFFLLAVVLPYAWLTAPVRFPSSQDSATLTLLAAAFGGALAYWAYHAILEQSRWQATPGKRLLRLRVTSQQGERISLAAATLRTWPHWILALIVAFRAVDDQYLEAVLLGLLFLAVAMSCIAVAFTRRKQGLHDKLAKCLVVRA